MRYIGNPKCVYNAMHPTLRCNVNPDGPCNGCAHFQSKSVSARIERYLKEMRLNSLYWRAIVGAVIRVFSLYAAAMADIGFITFIVLGWLISQGTSVFKAEVMIEIAQGSALLLILTRLAMLVVWILRCYQKQERLWDYRVAAFFEKLVWTLLAAKALGAISCQLL